MAVLVITKALMMFSFMELSTIFVDNSIKKCAEVTIFNLKRLVRFS
jgi:hypothetical protein